jgi:hypothetical protein
LFLEDEKGPYMLKMLGLV